MNKLTQTVDVVEGAVQRCSKMTPDEAAQLKKISYAISNPLATGWTSANHFAKHHTDIVTDIGAALQAKDNRDFATFGKQIGEAVALTILGKQEALMNLSYNTYRPV